MIEEEVPSALAGERLDRIVSLIADISRSDAAATIRSGAVRVGGEISSSGKIRLSAGEIVSIDEGLIPRPSLPLADENVALQVIFEDSDIIVIDKPAGLVVHPGPGHTDSTLVNGLLARFPEIADVGDPTRPGIVHRLDQGTSGLVVVARSVDAYLRLVEMLSQHQVTRRYSALVWGHLEADSMTIDAPIGRDPQDPLRMAVVSNGKPARTHVEVAMKYIEPEMSLLKCDLETGRTHQIRVHLRAIGHPVVGDPVYGSSRITGLKRPFLHAEMLEFIHPMTAAAMSFESPLPEDLAGFLGGLERAC